MDLIICPKCGQDYIDPISHFTFDCKILPKKCTHIWALKDPITRNMATQDYICIQCKEIKTGLRS